jgi:hypothetical protein
MSMKTFALLTAAAFNPTPVAAADVPLTFVRHDLNSGSHAQVTQGMGAGDVDGDRHQDLVVGGDSHLVVYRGPDFVPSLLAAGFKFGGGSAVTVHDVDHDGRLDVVTGRYPFDVSDLRESVWYENTPGGWVVHLLSAIGYCHDVAFGDLDGDGREDMGCADLFRQRISWLGRPADPRAEWTVHDVDQRHGQGMAIADVDRDGRLDMVSGRTWYRNAGGSPLAWQPVPLTSLVDDADRRFDDYAKVTVLDLDGDGRLDVFATLFADSREGQVWAFFQPPDPTTSEWLGVQIDPGPLYGVHSQGAGSFDGTSRPQLMVGETNIGGFGFGPNPSPEIYVYRRIGDARVPEGWERTRVDTRGTHEAVVRDLDGDGLSDIAGDEENTELVTPMRHGLVTWWQNTSPVPRPSTTTSTLPPCAGPACRPSPPCAGPGCRPSPSCDDPARCPSSVDCADARRRGLAAAACVCRVAGAGACADVNLPVRLARRRARACAALDRAASTRSDRASARRARTAARDLARTRRMIEVSPLPSDCADALSNGLVDAERRTKGRAS